MKRRVYIDTSVVGGYFDEEFAEDTKKFFNRIINKDFIIFFSEVSETELSLAPPAVQKLKSKISFDFPSYPEATKSFIKLFTTFSSEYPFLKRTSAKAFAYNFVLFRFTPLEVFDEKIYS